MRLARFLLALAFCLAGTASSLAQQPGKDGPMTVAAANTVLNKYARLSANAAAGATTINVTNPGGADGLDPATLTAGDLLLVIQMQGASIDTSYRLADFGSGNDEAFAIAIQSDGKLVLAGYSFNGANDDFAVMRFNADGSPDATFGGAGWVTTPIGAGNEQAIAVAIQTDGRIVAAGFTDAGGGNNDFALVRYNANGTLDGTFGVGGKVTTPVLAADDQARAVAIQTDGRIVVAGWAANATNYDFAVVRYGATGALDGTFGVGGKVTTAVGTSDDQAYAVAVQTDGKIVVAGDARNAGGNLDVAVVRYLGGGGLDGTFGVGGRVTTPIGAGDDTARDLALQPDGKLVVVGSTWNGANFDFAVLRYATGGALDATFAAGGVQQVALGSGNDLGYGLALQSDGKIVATGWTHNGTDWDYGLARLNSNGGLDTSFDVDGKLQAAVGNDDGFGEGVVVHPDGRIFVGGRSNNTFDMDFTLVGFDTDGTFSYGKVLSLGNAGNYELVPVASAAGSTITLGCSEGLQNAYTASGEAQVIKVPQYTTLTINSGASVTAPVWNGQYGGVVALSVSGTATLDGQIHAARRGFRGGSVEAQSADKANDWPDLVSGFSDVGAEKGEGIAGSQADYDALGGRYSRGAPANGGGGGGAHNAGGGGGANANAGGRWTGQGVMDGTVTGAAAWTLDPGYIANGNALTTSPGGGRAGYTYSDVNQNALVLGPRNAAWGGNDRRERGGLGGRPLSADPASRLFLGGGGGAGDGNGGGASRGGNGGGIVVLVADAVTGTGGIDARGEPGLDTTAPHEDGPGGGGAGGSIVVSATSLSGITIQADGGDGGNQLLPGFPDEAEGPGGGGGGGFIAVSGGAPTRTAGGGAGGTTLSNGLTEFPANGATRGAPGKPSELLTSLPGLCFTIGCSPQVSYRSVGTDSGIVYQTGLATIAIGTMTVDFSGGASLPTYVGQGDELVIGATTFYIDSRVSSTRVTVQSNAASTLTNQVYTIRRAYNTFQAWETARQGDLVGTNRREIAVAFDDGARGFADFTAGAVISGSTTDTCHYMKITVAPGQRHFGRAGAGALVTGVNAAQVFQVSDEFTRIEWLQIANATVTSGVVFVDSAASGAHSSFSNLLLHDYTSSSGGALRLSADAVVRNSIVYNGDVGIEVDTGARVAIENDTVYKMTTYGVQATGGATEVTVRNTISVGNTTSDFSLDQTISYFGYNLFGTSALFNPATCSGCVGANQVPPGNLDNLFVTITAGAEDLHIETGSAAVNTGVDLSSSFNADVDSDYRPMGAAWEIGADEMIPAGGCPVNDPAWYDSGWSYRTAVVINSAQVAGSLIDFPVLVQIPSDAALAADAQDDGDDILFTLSDGVTKLSHEIEYFDGVTGQLIAWVKVPFLSSGGTVLHLYFGNPTAGSQQNVFNTWSNGYEGVWHLKEASGSGAYIQNSAKNNYHGTPVGTVFNAAGKIDGARDFTDSGTQAIDLGGSTALFNAWPQFSYQFWIRPDYTSDVLWESLGEDWVFSHTGSPPVRLVRVRRFNWNTAGMGEIQSDIQFAGAGTQFRIVEITRQAWNHVLYSYDGSDLNIFVNGVLQDNTPIASDALVANSDAYAMGAGSGAFRGPLDEVRIATAGRSSAWALTEYNNQNNPAGFFSVCGPTTEVALQSFEARGVDEAVELTWKTASELNNLGFHLYRSASAGGPYERLTKSLIPGLGSSPVGAEYSYRDAGVENGVTYFYELEDVETTGATHRHGPVSATPGTGEGGLVPPTESRIRYGNPEANQFRVLARDRRGVVLELRTEGFFATPQGDGTVAIEIPGFVNEAEEGTPSIPVKRSWVEVEPGRRIRLQSVEAFDVESISGLRPPDAEAVEVVAGRNGTLRAERTSSIGRRTRAGRVLASSDLARLLTSGYQQSVKKALVEMVPLRWDPVQKKLVLVKRMVVRLQFGGPEERASRRRDLSKNAVVARLVARERGLYALRYEDLASSTRRRASFSSVRLSRLRMPVPYHLEPSSRPFGPGSTLYFVSDGAALNPYGREAVYELESGVSGPTMEVMEAAAPGSSSSLDFYWRVLEREENKYYQAALLDAPDLWLWDLVSAGQTKPFPFDVSALRAGDAEPSLEVHLQGASDFLADPDHHVRIYVNGIYLAESSWNGKKALTVATDVPFSLLHEGENVLEIENAGDTGAAYSMVMLDRFSLRYSRRPVAEASSLSGAWSASGVTEVSGLGAGASVVDLTTESPRWLRAEVLQDTARFGVVAGHRYFVAGRDALRKPQIRPAAPPRLLGAAHSASYLAIGPRSYLDAASDLLRLRREQGLSVEAVATEDIYDELGYGEKRPEAIRDFIAYAYDSWGSPAAPLRYVLLLGDGTYDFKDYLGLGARNEVPPLMVRTRYLWTASDPTLAAVHGEDPLPDLAIGRLPASSEAQVRVLAGKIVAYEATARRLEGPVVLVTDNPDSAGNFDADAREIATYVPRDRAVRFVSLSQEGVLETRASIRNAFDEGASVLSYLGHGGIQLWASENILDNSVVPLLAPQEEQPILLTMNCLNGYFHFPFFDSLSEALVEADGRGAVAAISPTGLSLDEPAHILHREMMKALFDPRYERLGDAVLAAEEAYAETGAFPELLRIYHLIGDPALKLR